MLPAPSTGQPRRLTVYWDGVVSYTHCARGPCMLFECLIHVGAWRYVRCIGLDVLIVYHRVVRHVILTQRCSMCGLFFLRFDGFNAVHREILAKRLYLKIGWRFGSLRFGMCVFVTFKLGVFLSLLSDVCHAVYLAVATISSLTVDMISQ